MPPFKYLPGTGRGTARFFSVWWRGQATGAVLAARPLHRPSDGPPPRAGEVLVPFGATSA
jgi:hypothetical protein